MTLSPCSDSWVRTAPSLMLLASVCIWKSRLKSGGRNTGAYWRASFKVSKARWHSVVYFHLASSFFRAWKGAACLEKWGIKQLYQATNPRKCKKIQELPSLPWEWGSFFIAFTFEGPSSLPPLRQHVQEKKGIFEEDYTSSGSASNMEPPTQQIADGDVHNVPGHWYDISQCHQYRWSKTSQWTSTGWNSSINEKLPQRFSAQTEDVGIHIGQFWWQTQS